VHGSDFKDLSEGRPVFAGARLANRTLALESSAGDSEARYDRLLFINRHIINLTVSRIQSSRKDEVKPRFCCFCYWPKVGSSVGTAVRQ
jgi:hypothetical protein